MTDSVAKPQDKTGEYCLNSIVRDKATDVMKISSALTFYEAVVVVMDVMGITKDPIEFLTPEEEES